MWRSSENFAASASNFSPSWNFTFGRSLMVTLLPSAEVSLRERKLRHDVELGVDVEQLVADRREHDAPHIGAGERRIEHVGVFGKADPQRWIAPQPFRSVNATSAAAAARRMVFIAVSPQLAGGRLRAPLPQLYQHRSRPARPSVGQMRAIRRSRAGERPLSAGVAATGGSSGQRWQAVAWPRRRSAPDARRGSARSRAGSAMQMAAGRRIDRARHVALQNGAVAPARAGRGTGIAESSACV